ncbi:MAG: MoxR family ATPase [Armatimonadetes bacterium]|nr:MoxR family ATPase [Armatimonadota bacterium]
MVITLLSGGHALLEGVPGIAKTLMVKTLAYVLNSEFKRIQFTPDLMPSDVVGTHVFETKTSSFYLKKGPIFANLVLADEINRTPPKTQSALLEAMEERQVTIEGERLLLPSPFAVFATQNPVEYEGTYPLPEAQVDRFMLKILVSYPTIEQEQAVLKNYHEGFVPIRLEKMALQPLYSPAVVEEAQKEILATKVEQNLFQYITQIVQKTRSNPNVTLGASPRASIALLLTSKALATLRGRDYVVPDDIKSLAYPVLRHRLLLRPEAEIEGLRTDDVIRTILASVEVPR